MQNIDSSVISDAVRQLCIQAATILPLDVRTALENAMKNEDNVMAKEVLGMVLKNADDAQNRGIPICQDTGMTHVFLELGQDACIRGDLNQAVYKGVAQGYTLGHLRKSVVKDPLFFRENTGDNTPPVIHTEIAANSSYLKITVLPKGTGSENMSALSMLKPSEGVEGVKSFVIDTVRKAGPNSCPPLVVGVGVGGMMDHAALLSKKALMRPVGVHNRDTRVADFETEMLMAINSLGVGPAGLGGKTTALWVSVETYPTHIGALPVAVNLQCHAARRAQAVVVPNETGGQILMPKPQGEPEHGPRFDSHRSWDGAKSVRMPLDSQDVLSSLRAGEKVLLTGTMYTARDAAHKRLVEELNKEEAVLPFDLHGQFIFYAGPCPPKPGQTIGALGPTTSGRMDAYTPQLLEAGLKGMVGKGSRSQKVIDAIKRHGAVYFVTVGGLGAYLSKTVAKAQLLCYEDLGPEAVFRLEVVDFPAIVGIDSLGKDIYGLSNRE